MSQPTGILKAMFPGKARRRFLGECWPNQHRHFFYHGDRRRLSDLIDTPELQDLHLLARRHHELVAQDSRGEGTLKAAAFSASHLHMLLDAKVPMDFRDVQDNLPSLRRWGSQLGRELGLSSPCICNVFVSPDKHGLDKHFDDKDVFVVGVTGRKTFYVAPNDDVVHPLHNGGPMFRDKQAWLQYAKRPPSGQMPRGTIRHDIIPGSVLFIPRGYWHKTVSRGLSWSISIGFARPTWLALAREQFRSQLLRRPAWTMLATDCWSLDPARRSRALSQLQALLDQLPASLDASKVRAAAHRSTRSPQTGLPRSNPFSSGAGRRRVP